MERDGRGGKREKINQGGPDPGLMSRRTCANRSGSLAGGPSLPCRVDSNFLPHDLDSTAAYLNPVLTLLFICLPSSLIYYYYFLVPSLRSSANLVIFPLLSCITFPSSLMQST